MSLTINPGFDKTYDELITYYPLFYRDVREMKAILEANGDLLDLSISEIIKVLDNAFIDKADNDMIERLERFLRIKPDPLSSYEERRKAIKLYFTGFGKISASKLKELIYQFTETEASITFSSADQNGNNLLAISIPRGENSTLKLEDLVRLLFNRIPVHIWHDVTFVNSKENELFFGFVTADLKETTVSSEDEDVSNIPYLVNEIGETLTDECGNILFV